MNLTESERKKLLRIRQHVVDTHWTKGKYYTIGPSGKWQACLTGLVNLECGAYASKPSDVGDYGERGNIIYVLSRAIHEQYGDRQIEAWNDAQKRERQDVLDLIDKALYKTKKERLWNAAHALVKAVRTRWSRLRRI